MNAMNTVTLRQGTTADAPVLRRIFAAAGEGVAEYFWEKAREPGQSLEDVALDRMIKKIDDPKNGFWVAEVDGQPAGGVLSHAITEVEPLDDLSPMLRSFVAFENDLVGTYYVNALAVFPEFQRKGIGSKLLNQALLDAGERQLSLAVSDANHGARRTYEAFGFEYGDAFPMCKDGWDNPGENWLAMRLPMAD